MSALAIYLFVLFVALLIGLVMWLGLLVTACVVMVIVLICVALEDHYRSMFKRL